MPRYNKAQKLSGRIVLISGAGSGIGRALALRAAYLGADIILVGRRVEKLQAVHDEIKSMSEKAFEQKQKVSCIVADIRNQDDRSSLFHCITEEFGRIDYLVNNAGVLRVGLLSALSNDDIQNMMDTNVIAHIVMTRDALPLLQNSNHARVVNVGSVFGDIAFPLFSVYSMTKFAMRGFSDALRRELSSQNISVTYVAPRAARTEATPEFENLIEAFSMTVDQPEHVARSAWDGILKGKCSIYPKGPERLFVFIQNLAPRLVDGGIIKQFSSWMQNSRHRAEKEKVTP